MLSLIYFNTSGIDQTRNYKWYKLVYPNGTIDDKIHKGGTKFKQYVDGLNLGITGNSLLVNGKSRGYTFIKYDK